MGCQRRDLGNFGHVNIAYTCGKTFWDLLGQSSLTSFVVVFPAFQRTHVATNAVGVLLRWCLDLPTTSPPGLGLRRVQWCTHSKNLASARLAERMGFRREAQIRWQWVLPEERAYDSERARKEDKWPERYGRHTVMLSTCWDDWENGVKEIMEKQVDRRV